MFLKSQEGLTVLVLSPLADGKDPWKDGAVDNLILPEGSVINLVKQEWGKRASLQ